MENVFLIAGLGNPGAEYAQTRHNAGFMAVENLAARHHARWTMAEKFCSRIARVAWEGSKLLLCQPQSYMNVSGGVVGPMARFYRIPASRVLVVVDDADLAFGELRLRPRGSSGGHHGLESLEAALGTREYPRLRIGIGRRPDAGREITDYVLSRFTVEERRELGLILDRACQQIECWFRDGPSLAMSRFNGAVAPKKSKEN